MESKDTATEIESIVDPRSQRKAKSNRTWIEKVRLGVGSKDWWRGEAIANEQKIQSYNAKKKARQKKWASSPPKKPVESLPNQKTRALRSS